jgi:hypothetical protein
MMSAIPADLGQPAAAVPSNGAEPARHDLFAALMDLLTAAPAPEQCAASIDEAPALPGNAARLEEEARETEELAPPLEAPALLAASAQPPEPIAAPARASEGAEAEVSLLRVAPRPVAAQNVEEAVVEAPPSTLPSEADARRSLIVPPSDGEGPQPPPEPQHATPRAPANDAPSIEPADTRVRAQAESSPQPHTAVPEVAVAMQRVALGHASRAIAISAGARPELGLEPVPVDTTSRSSLRAEATLPATAPAQVLSDAPVAPVRAAESARPVVANAVWLAEQGGGEARLELSPPELGRVELVVRVRGKRVEVHVRAEESAAQQVVRDSRERLADALAARDLRMESFSVGGGGAGATGSDSRGAERESAPLPASARAAAPPQPRERSAPRGLGAEGGAIDLRV